MPLNKAFEGRVDYLQVMDKDGNVDAKLEPKIPDEALKGMYRHMVLARKWDRKNLALQRTGRMYTYAPVEGQEAILVGAGTALQKSDWIFPTYRETYIYHMRGVDLWKISLTWKGNEEGSKMDRSMRMWPACVPIATQFPYATGAGYALKMRGEKAAALVFGGDGSTSEGDFHDACNFGGVLGTPTVFLVSNNGWAISVPRKLQTKSETIAQKALAYGFSGIQVDGNDILAVYSAVKEALRRAYDEKQPTLIEAITYRIGPHTTADDPKKYRNEEEVAYWRERDPIKRFRTYLEKKGLWSQELEDKLNAELDALVEDTVKRSEEFKPDPKDIFRFVYGPKLGLTKNLEEQMKECFGD